jgi:hypothetical protein
MHRLLLFVALIPLACAGPGSQFDGVPDPVPPPYPPGFGTASFTFSDGLTLPGAIQGWDDVDNADQWVQAYPNDLRFVVTASDWPKVEGPADLTASCHFDTTRTNWDWCSFHFTEMKLGNLTNPGLTGGSWFFHGTMEAGKGTTTLVRATF